MMKTEAHDEHMHKRMHELMETAKQEKLEHCIKSHDAHMNHMYAGNKKYEVKSYRQIGDELK